MSQQTQERTTPQFEQRVAAAMDALRAGEDRDELMESHGQFVVKEAEKRLS